MARYRYEDAAATMQATLQAAGGSMTLQAFVNKIEADGNNRAVQYLPEAAKRKLFNRKAVALPGGGLEVTLSLPNYTPPTPPAPQS